MNDLVVSNNGKAITNSLVVAEKFGKQHKHIMQSIKDLITSAEKSANLFVESEYPDAYGRMQPMYIMNRDGFSLLVMGFTGDRALAFKLDFIEAFNKMESHIQNGGFQVPTSFSEALLLAAKQAERIETQQKQLEAQSPKVLFADAVCTSSRSCLISELAKIITQNGFEIGQNRLFEWLRSKGYLLTKGEYYNQPSQWAIERGFFEVKKTAITKPDGTVLVTSTTKCTGTGQIYFVNKFLKKEV